ncbi:MAG TPA: hypothetical protein H9726_02895 [Candidatus Borkfalkia avicola]|uniref:Uncharacterized protein n=1 Tax=Candidatus Borkfalkia avicola TaxID=2838503 RepID=A0A9D2IHM8_9FIRM|nr:hypothetical protein [Candidatus Borkfalkia avicola]
MRREEVTEALRRRALGYEADEVVEEYGFTEGEAVLLKRKVTKKDVPPDIQAAKLLLEAEEPLAALTDEQLEQEKARLLLRLREEEEGEKRGSPP